MKLDYFFVFVLINFRFFFLSIFFAARGEAAGRVTETKSPCCLGPPNAWPPRISRDHAPARRADVECRRSADRPDDELSRTSAARSLGSGELPTVRSDDCPRVSCLSCPGSRRRTRAAPCTEEERTVSRSRRWPRASIRRTTRPSGRALSRRHTRRGDRVRALHTAGRSSARRRTY